MKPRYRALIYNFLAFAVFFIIARFGIVYIINVDGFYIAVVAAIIATLLAPKFAVLKSGEKEAVLMKWIFLKGTREI